MGVFSSIKRQIIPLSFLISTSWLASHPTTSWNPSSFHVGRTLQQQQDNSISHQSSSADAIHVVDIATNTMLQEAFQQISFNSSDHERCNPNNNRAFCRRARCDTAPREPWLEAPQAKETLSSSNITQNCKTLWFAGMSLGKNSQCTAQGGGYQMEYAMALASARLMAKDSLQPVLMVSSHGHPNSTIEAKDFPIAKWAQSQGAIVLSVDKLSFQHVANKLVGPDSKGKDHAVGPYLRMDIPQLIKEHGLFDIPNVCPRHVMYTDSDVLFVNPITRDDMTLLKSSISSDKDAFLTYGLEYKINSNVPFNTGVFVFDVLRWDKEWSDILAFGNNKGPFVSFDQGWMNAYFSQDQDYQKKVALLPRIWNWKTYWTLGTGSLNDIKVLHFHGPKPGIGLWDMASCSTGNWTFDKQFNGYIRLIQQGICCNEGKVAQHAQKIYNLLKPYTQSACSNARDML